MTEQKPKCTHTPGPWKVHDDGLITGGYSYCTIVCDTYVGKWEARKQNCADRAREARATAALIGAAPELLLALEGVIHHNAGTKAKYSLPESLLRHIHTAIAKTKGEN